MYSLWVSMVLRLLNDIPHVLRRGTSEMSLALYNLERRTRVYGVVANALTTRQPIDPALSMFWGSWIFWGTFCGEDTIYKQYLLKHSWNLHFVKDVYLHHTDTPLSFTISSFNTTPGPFYEYWRQTLTILVFVTIPILFMKEIYVLSSVNENNTNKSLRTIIV